MGHKEHTTRMAWDDFKYKQDVYYCPPTKSQLKEVHHMLTEGDAGFYVTDLNDYHEKSDYWHSVHSIYSTHKFVMPYMHRLGKEIKFYDIWEYHFTPEHVEIVEEILKALHKIGKEYMLKEGK